MSLDGSDENLTSPLGSFKKNKQTIYADVCAVVESEAKVKHGLSASPIVETLSVALGRSVARSQQSRRTENPTNINSDELQLVDSRPFGSAQLFIR